MLSYSVKLVTNKKSIFLLATPNKIISEFTLINIYIYIQYIFILTLLYKLYIIFYKK